MVAGLYLHRNMRPNLQPPIPTKNYEKKMVEETTYLFFPPTICFSRKANNSPTTQTQRKNTKNKMAEETRLPVHLLFVPPPTYCNLFVGWWTSRYDLRRFRYYF